jgi:hypothetical protein
MEEAEYRAWWARAEKQHRGFEQEWRVKSESWLERSLGRLVGTYQGCVNIHGFHRAAANKYAALLHSSRDFDTLVALEDKLNHRIGLVMQQACYGPEACDDIDI